MLHENLGGTKCWMGIHGLMLSDSTLESLTPSVNTPLLGLLP
jgi:hypothetical protein